MNETPPNPPRAPRLWAYPVIGALVLTLVLASASSVIWRPAPAPLPPKVLATPTPEPVAMPASAASLLGLLPITSDEKPDEKSIKHFQLRIPIKAQYGASVDAHSLVIHVLFYDLVNDQSVAQTSANVSSRWATPPADWIKSDTEELDVEYRLPKPPDEKRENRKYYGYIVRVYYMGHLQAAEAQPLRLAQEHPAPPTIDYVPARPKVAANPSPTPVKTSTADNIVPPKGFAGGATLDLFPIKVQSEPDDSVVKRLLLCIPIKSRPAARIDVKDVTVQVLFYDILDQKDVVETNATVNSHWASPPDWIGSDNEELNVEYVLPKPDADVLARDRKYFGYLVRLYYKGKLQATTADPDQLKTQHPPPATYP